MQCWPLNHKKSKPDFLQYISFISNRACWRKSCHIGRMSHKRGFPVLLPTLCRPCHPPHMVASSVISTLAAGEGLSLVLHVKISKAGKSGIRVIHTCIIRQIQHKWSHGSGLRPPHSPLPPSHPFFPIRLTQTLALGWWPNQAFNVCIAYFWICLWGSGGGYNFE